MGRIPKPVRNPRKMVDPRVLTPLDQISRYYGGRGATQGAIQDAGELARQLTAIDDIDGGNYRTMFPEVGYGRYEDELLINPVPEEVVDEHNRLVYGDMAEGDFDDFDEIGLRDKAGRYPEGYGFVNLPGDVRDTGNSISLATADNIEAPELADQHPSISFVQEYPTKNPVVFAEDGDAALSPGELQQAATARGAEGLRRGEVATNVEMPMTDYVTEGFPSARKNMPTGTDAQLDRAVVREIGKEIDPILAQIRRASGATTLEPDDAAMMIAEAIGRSSVPGVGVDEVDAVTGLTMDKLQMLAELPPEAKAFLPRRIRELLSLGGISTGLLSQGGEPQQQGIDPRSTMGPLGGLMD